MTNKILEEYLERLRASLSPLPGDEREAVIAETRAHLEEAIAARMIAEPDVPLARVTLQETSAFGEPAEIAAARGAAPRAGGARMFSLPRWAKLLAAAVAVVLVAVVAVDLIDKPTSFTAYQRDTVLEGETTTIDETFTVAEGTQTLAITVRVQRDAGCTGVRITDPSGDVVLDQWDACGDISKSVEAKPSLSGRTGEWRVELRHQEFTGDVLVLIKGTRN